MSNLSKQEDSDQNSHVNFVLKELGIKWRGVNATSQPEDIHDTVFGDGTPLKVALLPYDLACRKTCMFSKRENYYVWHAMQWLLERAEQWRTSKGRLMREKRGF